MRVISSLRHAFTFHYIITAVVPILLFGWFSFSFIDSYLLNDVYRTNEFLAHEVQAQTEDFLTHHSESMKRVARSVFDHEQTSDQNVDLYLSEEVESARDFESIYILNRSGKIVYMGVSAFNRRWEEDFQGVDLSGHELFKRFDRGEEPGWSSIYPSLLTGEPTISFGLTYSEYLVVSNISLQKLSEIVSRFSLYDQSLSSAQSNNNPLTFAIIDRKGIPIAHTDDAMVHRQQSMRFHPEVVNALSGHSTTSIYSHEGKQKVETGLPVSEAGWVVWISRDYDLLLQPFRAAHNIFFLILAAAIAFAVFSGLVTSRKILRPLRRLIKEARALASGGEDFQQERRSYDEIDELTHGFRSMAHSVREREQSLRKSEARFRSLVNTIEGIVFEIDFPEMDYTFVSDRVEQISGYSAQTWLETQDFWRSCIHPDDRQWAFHYCKNQSEGGRNHQFEYRLLHRDGYVVWIRQLVNLVVEDGDICRLVGVMIDITSSKESAIALQESELRFRSLVEQAADAIYIFDAQGQLVDVNEQACRSLFFNREELKLKNISDIQILQSPLEFKTLQNSVMRGGALTFEAEQRGKSGRLVPVEIRLGSFHYQNRPLFLALVRDITDRKLAESALKESEEKFRLLLDSTAEGVFGMDCEGQCTFCNPAGLKLLGFDKEQDLLGKNVHNLFHQGPDNKEVYQQEECAICNVCITGQEAHSDSESFIHTDGHLFAVEYFSQPIIKDNFLVGGVVVFHDVTERKRLQQQNIRTAQLASLGELAAGVAHEINNPISGVINYAQIMLNRHKGSGQDKDLLERIVKEGERVATIVRDLLFFSRESGPEKNLSNIQEILEYSLSLSAAQIRKEGILLEVDCAEDLPLIYIWTQQIQQLFLNILSNARHALLEKYSSQDENKKIEISIKTIVHGGEDYVRIVFKDFGIGISKQMIDRVLHPFVTTKSAGVGTGLGLSISFEIVKNHGGRLWVESIEGESTEVYVELPTTRKD
jgi:PAS domain S-box-containing protein